MRAISHLSQKSLTVYVPTMANDVADGWDNDDDLDLDDVDEPQEQKDGDDNNAWSFQDDDILLNQSDEVNNQQQQQPAAAVDESVSQWSFEDDDILNESSTVNDAEPAPLKQNEESVDEWSFHDDDILNASLAATTPKPPPDVPVAKQESDIVESLVKYLESLSKMLPSLNAVLEAEYNIPTHAMELVEYYQSRPQLRDYTLETELPRMEYQVVLEDAILRDHEQVYNYLSQAGDSILVRSANQSLLPDILTVLTGPDLFIRPQLLATAVAQTCKFTLQPDANLVVCNATLHLSLPDGSGQRLDVARLDVSIRFSTTSSLPEIQYRLDSVELLVPLADAEYELHSTAQFLASMHNDDDMHNNEDMLFQQDVSSTSPNNHEKNLDLFRDKWMSRMSKTHQIVKATNTGLKSTLKEIDSVANVSKKLNFIKRAAGNTLATTDEIIKLSELSSSVPSEMVHQQQQGRDGQRGPPPPPPRSSGRQERGPPPPPPPRSGGEERPAPILGGLLFSGLSRLAKSVTLPEEDPSMYSHVQQSTTSETAAAPQLYRNQGRRPPPPPPSSKAPESQKQTATAPSRRSRPPPPPPPNKQGIPKLYRKEESSPAAPKLYRKEAESPAALKLYRKEETASEAPKLYRKEETETPKLYREDVETTPTRIQQPRNVPQLYRKDGDTLAKKKNRPPPPPPPRKKQEQQVVQDGWDDEDDDLGLDDNDNLEETSTPPSPKKKQQPQQPHPLDLEVSTLEYNEEDDIIETRTRWVNPRLVEQRRQVQV